MKQPLRSGIAALQDSHGNWWAPCSAQTAQDLGDDGWWTPFGPCRRVDRPEGDEEWVWTGGGMDQMVAILKPECACGSGRSGPDCQGSEACG